MVNSGKQYTYIGVKKIRYIIVHIYLIFVKNMLANKDMESIPKTIGAFVELLKRLIEPTANENVYECERYKNFSRKLDRAVTYFCINLLTDRNNQINYTQNVGYDFLQLLYTYSNAKARANPQFLQQPRGEWCIIDRKIVRQITIIDSRTETQRWDLNHPKYYNYPYHVLITRFDPMKEIQRNKRRLIENLSNINFEYQKKFFMDHIHFTGNKTTEMHPYFSSFQRLNYIADFEDVDLRTDQLEKPQEVRQFFHRIIKAPAQITFGNRINNRTPMGNVSVSVPIEPVTINDGSLLTVGNNIMSSGSRPGTFP